MRTIRWGRWLISGFAALGLGVAGYLAIGYWAPILPIQLPSAVTQLKDGRIKIKARDEVEAARYLGWMAAKERSWQLELQRLAASAQLSMVFGAKAAPLDKAYAPIGHQIDQQVISRRTQALLESFAQGVNQFWSDHPWRIGIEFFLLRHRPAPWKVRDSMLLMRQLAWTLSANFDAELVNLQLLQAGVPLDLIVPRVHGAGALFDLPPESWQDVVAQLGSPGELPEGIEAFPDWAQLPEVPSVKRLSGGSNAWAVPTDEGAILCADPHLDYSFPLVWMLVDIELPDGTISGVVNPGIPAVLMGTSPKISWAITMAYLDTQDLLLVPADQLDKVTGYVMAKNEKWAWVLQWSMYDSASRQNVEVFYDLAKVERLEDVSGIMQNSLNMPGINLVMADRWGSVGHLLLGLVPFRNRSGMFPLISQNGATPAWTGVTDRFPMVTGRPVVSANQALLGDDHSLLFGNAFLSPSRSERIFQLLESQPKHWRDHSQFQLDNLSTIARDLMPFLIPILGTGSADQIMKNWDFRYDQELRAPVLFEEWLKQVLSLIAEKHQMPSPAKESWLDRNQTRYGLRAYLMADPENAELAEQAWAQVRVNRAQGTIPTWREAHGVTFKHPMGAWVGLGPLPKSGGRDVVDNDWGHGGASFRMCVQHAKNGARRQGQLMIPLGNSGHWSQRSLARQWWDKFRMNDGYPLLDP